MARTRRLLHPRPARDRQTLAVIVKGRDVTKHPELWPATERDYRGPGRLELFG